MAARRRRNNEDEEQGQPEWMTTYSDLVTLLLTFFVLLFSMSTIQETQKYEEITNSMRSAFSRISSIDIFKTNAGNRIITVKDQNGGQISENNEANEDQAVTETDSIIKAEEKRKKLETVKGDLQAAIEEANLEEYVEVIDEKTTVTLRINSVVLFDSGKADIKETGKPVLKKLGNFLKGLDHNIVIQGHTDSRPINTYLYPSNWELSTKRATNVVIFLIENCSLEEARLTATGNAEFKPVAPNDTAENRQKNRRIDIVIEK